MLIQRDFYGVNDIGEKLRLLRTAPADNCIDFFTGGGAVRRLHVIEKIVCAHLQRLRKGDQHRKTELGISRFNMAHMRHGDADLFRQFLLRKPQCLAVFSHKLG